MKVLVFSQVFWPENFKINEMCTELVRLGHQVTVVTGKPNYPKGKFYNGYGLFSKIKTNYKGIIIYRLPIIPRGSANSFLLSLNYLSFALIGSFFSLFHYKKYDFSFVFAVSPITSAIPAIVHKFIYGTKHYLWVLDLWPEAALVTGKLKNKYLIRLLDYLVEFIYKNSNKIYISSLFMKKSILKKLYLKNSNKIIYLPNWAEDVFKIKNLNKDKYLKIIPEGFKVMFAGNISYAQDFPSIIKTAKILKKHKNIKFIIIGDGSEKKYLINKIKEFQLENIVYYLGSFPIEEMINLYFHADIMLLTLKNELIYKYTVPGKFQGYIASNKPVIGMVNGETSDIIKKSKCGFVVDAEDYISLSRDIIKLSKMSKKELNRFGQNGKKYYDKFFKKNKIIKTFINSVNTNP